MKVLVDRAELTKPLSELAPSHLSDADPFVRRAAAEVLGAHPALANIRPLLALRQSTPGDDTHLIHVVRIALRDQLKNAEVWSRLDSLNLTERDRRDIADVATGVHTEGAAGFLLAHIKAYRRAASRLASLSSTTSRVTARPPRCRSWSRWRLPKSGRRPSGSSS